MNAEGPLVVTQLRLSELLSADRNTLVTWTRAGMPVARRGRGSRGYAYDVGACVRWIRERDRAQHERAMAAAKAASGVDTARARKLTAGARLAELDVRKREGEVIAVAEVDRRWAAIAAEIRTALLGLPSRLNGRRAGLKPADLAALDDLIRETLERLADRGTNHHTPKPEHQLGGEH